MKRDVTFHAVTEQSEILWGCFLLQAGERREDGGSWLPSRGSNSEAPCKEPVFEVLMLPQEEAEKSMSGPGTDVDTCFAIQ